MLELSGCPSFSNSYLAAVLREKGDRPFKIALPDGDVTKWASGSSSGDWLDVQAI